MEEKHFRKDFQTLAAEPHVYNNMMVEEMNVTGLSPNGRHHSILFVDKLHRALRYAQIVCLTKYEEALDQYITPEKKATRRVKFGQLQDDDISIDSDDSTHTRKRGKQEDMSTTYMTRFYTFVLGLQVNANDQGGLLWMKRDTIHLLFTKLQGKCKYISELQGMRTKWDRDLRDTRSEVYLQVVKKTLAWSHVFVKKMQSADWSTEEAGEEGPSSLCVDVFTPVSSDQQTFIINAVQDVEMDGLLDQPAHARSVIRKNLRISYKISSTHDATKTLASLLATLSNLAGWKPGQSPRQANQPKVVDFLEQVMKKLVSTQGRNWQHKFQGQLHLGVAILVKVQRIMVKLVVAAGDPEVKEWNFEDGPMPHDSNLDLQEAFHLMEYFLQDLHRAII